MSKTREEVEALKANWLQDPCWDIEKTEGFEEYASELLSFRMWQEVDRDQFATGHNMQENDLARIYAMLFERFHIEIMAVTSTGCNGDFTEANEIYKAFYSLRKYISTQGGK